MWEGADKVIGMMEIDGGVDMDFTHSGKEIRNEGKRISVLLRNFIEALVIYAKAEGFVFLERKNYQSSMGGRSGLDESRLSSVEMVVKEVPENFKFRLGEGIYWNNWRSSFFQVNFEVIRLMQG